MPYRDISYAISRFFEHWYEPTHIVGGAWASAQPSCRSGNLLYVLVVQPFNFEIYSYMFLKPNLK